MGNWSRQARLAWGNKNFLQAGDFFKLDGNYRAAVKAYIKAQNYGEAAKIYEGLGKIKKAQKLLEKTGSPQEMADFYLRNDNPDRALAVFLSNGMDFDGAELLERLNKLDEAARLYEKAGFTEKAGVLYGRAKNFDKAIDMFQRVLNVLDPQTGPQVKVKKLKYLDWIANLQVGAKRYAEAAEIFDQLNQKEKAAKCYLKAGNYPKSAEMFIALGLVERAKIILAKTPSLESRILLGQIAMQEGRFEEAAQLLHDSGKNELLCKVYEQLGRFRDAAFHLEKIGDLHRAAEMYATGKDHQKAAILFEQQGFYDDAAMNYEMLQKYGQAAKLYQMAKNRFKAGYCLYKSQRLDEALVQLQELGPESGQEEDAQKVMAEIFFKLGKYAVARNLLERLTTDSPLDSDSMPYFYLLARCLEAENNFESAKKYYERILSSRIGYADVDERLSRIQSRTVRPDQTLRTMTEPHSPYAFKDGDLVADRFRILKTLGKGGMGFIFKVRDLSLNKDIALKMLIHDRGNFEELKAELITARDLTHPYIIKVFDIGEWMNIGYFTMEYVEGEPLKEFIHSHHDMSIEAKIKLMIKICEGLNAAHEQGVVHRDMKPQNIIIDRHKNPKILDFGIARKVKQNRRDSSVSGSPKYMAPEQIQNLDTDVRTDVYALGIIMFYMFTLKEPFVARTAQEIMMMQMEQALPNPSTFNSALPFWLSEIIARCAEKVPDMRYGNVGELMEELRLNCMDMES